MQTSEQKKIVIVTTGQPSTNPRMVKAYQALKEEGYQVKVFYSFWNEWALKTDKEFLQKEKINASDFVLVGGSPEVEKFTYILSKIRYKVLRIAYLRFGLVTLTSMSRTTAYLGKAASKKKADLYIAHNLGALPAAVSAAKRNKAKAGFDAEDFHRGEFKDQQTKEAALVKAIEDKYIPQCEYLTAASPLIAEAYGLLYNLRKVSVVNNVFSKKYLQPLNKKTREGLTLFWFSQTIGPDRGLETIVQALNLLNPKYNIELYLLGKVSSEFKEQLLSLSSRMESLHFLNPVPPDEIFSLSSTFDIGLAIEVPDSQNREYCLTNKIFTYFLSGNCIIFSNTKAQAQLCEMYPGSGFLFEPGNCNQLASILSDLYNTPEKVEQAKRQSHAYANSHFNWEREKEIFKSAMVNAIS